MRKRRPTAAVAARTAVEQGRAIGKLILAFQPRAGHGIGHLDVAIAAWASDQLGSHFAAHYNSLVSAQGLVCTPSARNILDLGQICVIRRKANGNYRKSQLSLDSRISLFNALTGFSHSDHSKKSGENP